MSVVFCTNANVQTTILQLPARFFQRNLAAQRAETSEHRLSGGRPDGGEPIVFDIRVSQYGSEKVHGHIARKETDGSGTGAQLSVPNYRRDAVLPSASRSASRSEAAESADQQRRCD